MQLVCGCPGVRQGTYLIETMFHERCVKADVKSTTYIKAIILLIHIMIQPNGVRSVLLTTIPTLNSQAVEKGIGYLQRIEETTRKLQRQPTVVNQ